jgi:hypothetical protein
MYVKVYTKGLLKGNQFSYKYRGAKNFYIYNLFTQIKKKNYGADKSLQERRQEKRT